VTAAGHGSPPDHVAWFKRTGHCGQCGNPGNYCTCPPTKPCQCHELHEMGSGLTPDALEQFATVPVSDNQEGLF
jgi:hypothetical protein